MQLTPNEKKLIAHAKKQVVRFNKMRLSKGEVDTVYAFILSYSGKIHDGACLETPLKHVTICAERHAIANMIMSESYNVKIKSIVVADPVPELQKHGRSPCGTDRHLIWHYGTPKTTVLLMQCVLRKSGFTFPQIEKYNIKQLYPIQYEPPENLWPEDWEPK